MSANKASSSAALGRSPAGCFGCAGCAEPASGQRELPVDVASGSGGRWLSFEFFRGPRPGRPTFPRGIHPPSCKDLSAGKPLEVLPPPDQVVLPLHQHAGAPAEVVVRPRECLRRGALVGEAPQGTIGARVHASLAGKVQPLIGVNLPNGRHSLAVPIVREPDTQESTDDLLELVVGGEWPRIEPRQDPASILAIIRDAGIVGLGGAAFPTDFKLAASPLKPIQTLLVNGSECEPYLTGDYRLMVEAAESIVAGMLVAKSACRAREIVLAIEDNKPLAIRAMDAAIAGIPDVRLVVCQSKYPMGGERQLIPAVFRMEVPTGGFPSDIGIVVLNVGTAVAIAGAFYRELPLTHRVVSISGRGVVEPKNLWVPIGTAFGTILDYCGGLTEDAARIIAGGPMMGFTVTDLSVPLTKGTSGITVLSHAEIEPAERSPCIRCGRCLDVCPLHLSPTQMAHAAEREDYESAQRFDLFACCECGCCAYACPARIPLVQWIRAGKFALLRSG